MKKLYREKLARSKEYLKSLLKPDLHPRKISLSLALGIFVGITVPMGFQTLVLIPLSALFRCNFPISWGTTYISNPLTILPIYFVAGGIGEKLTGIHLSQAKLNGVITSPGFKSIMNLGGDTLAVIFIGSLLLGLLLSAATYFLSLEIITRHRNNVKQHSDSLL